MNDGTTFEEFFGERVAVKAKRFNTILNKEKASKLQHSIDEYRRMSDGE